MRTGKLFRVLLLLPFIIACLSAKSQLTADFSATPTSGCSPLVVSFTDQSTGNPTSWRWDLGNGTTSILKNPSVIYFTPGTYTVKLVVSNASGRDSVVKTDVIEVNAKPTVSFSVSKTTGCYPLNVQFTDSSEAGSGNIESWIWDFGDGSTSTLQNPSHTYTSARNFNVTLQVRNSFGCVTTLTRNNLVRINTGVLADFSNDNTQTCTAPVTINFHDSSIGTGALSYLWNFGDNNTSTNANPVHTYTRSGNYTVTLIVSNSHGCADTITKPNSIIVGSVRPGFSAVDTVCMGSNTRFINTSVPAPAGVHWDFGDGASSTNLSPTKSYAVAGNYTVKMVANFGSCVDSVEKPITVIQTPQLSFAASETNSCKAPLNVTFTNTSTDAVSYSWNFGDNGSSVETSPTYSYNSFGSYTVKLTATGIFGCTSTLTKTDYIKLARPRISPVNFPDSGCVPFTKNFDINVNTPDSIVSYFWNFGDGNTDTVASPTHTYTVDGAYNITVIVVTAVGCTDTLRVNRGIIASNKPTANFSATPRETCAKTNILFTDLSTGGPTKWFWEFGDRTTSTIKNPSKLYQDTGFFTVKLTIWRGGCADSITFNRYIYIKPPIAKFTIIAPCQRPFEKTFTNQSIGGDQVLWDFGDGNTSTDTGTVTHVYANQGLYTVTLKVTNLSTGCDHSTSKTLRVLSTDAFFTADDTVLCKGTGTRFASPVSGSDINGLSWSFGDGNPPVVTGPGINSTNYSFVNSGTYTVRLILRNRNNCRDTFTRVAYIKVDGPTAKFGATVPSACANTPVLFSDSSSSDGVHPLQSWTWNYGDNTSETLTAPPFQHAYATAGRFNVSLVVTDTKGCKDTARLMTPVAIAKPAPNFTSPDTFSCPGKTVRFINRTPGTGNTFHWDFGDGATATTSNPTHVYQQDGLYTVKLVAWDASGCTDSIVKINYITIASPVAAFTVSDSIGNCPPLIVTFNNRSAASATRKWDFGDSTYSTENNPVHFYNYPGTYIATLTITVPGGCTNTFSQRIVVKGPQGTFSYSPLTGCSPLRVSFAASTTNSQNSFIWDFNDGSTLGTPDSAATHIYTYPGRFLPKMILVDPAGCKVPLKGTDTIVITGLGAKFGFDKSLVCDSGAVSFSDSSYGVNDVVLNYLWNFGDGTTSTLRNPVHHYARPGIYYPTLITAGRSGCDDTARTTIPIRISTSPKITISATPNGCAPLTVTLGSQLLVTDTSNIAWRWRLPDGSILTANPPTINYANAGSYTFTLTGTNSSGCSDSVSKVVEAYAKPVVNAGEDKILCEGSTLMLQASGAATYSWSPATALSCINCPNPVTTTPSNIAYTVVGTSAQGCVAADTVAVSFKKKFTFKYSNSDSVCKGQSKNLSASGATRYQWSPAEGLSSTNSATTTATPLTTTVYRVVGSDDIGCFQDTGYIAIRVNPIPTVEAGNDVTMAAGTSVDLIPQVSADVTTVNWSPTDGLFRNFFPGITVKPETNTEYTVEVKNKGGCTARDRVTVYVICNGGNLFVPNTFSPNGDGVNDVFYPRGTGLFKIKQMRIFTRWGELLYDKSDFNANAASFGWDGTKRGMKLDPDVFVYTLEVICDNGSIIIYRGNIALVK